MSTGRCRRRSAAAEHAVRGRRARACGADRPLAEDSRAPPSACARSSARPVADPSRTSRRARRRAGSRATGARRSSRATTTAVSACERRRRRAAVRRVGPGAARAAHRGAVRRGGGGALGSRARAARRKPPRSPSAGLWRARRGARPPHLASVRAMLARARAHVRLAARRGAVLPPRAQGRRDRAVLVRVAQPLRAPTGRAAGGNCGRAGAGEGAAPRPVARGGSRASCSRGSRRTTASRCRGGRRRERARRAPTCGARSAAAAVDTIATGTAPGGGRGRAASGGEGGGAAADGADDDDDDNAFGARGAVRRRFRHAPAAARGLRACRAAARARARGGRGAPAVARTPEAAGSGVTHAGVLARTRRTSATTRRRGRCWEQVWAAPSGAITHGHAKRARRVLEHFDVVLALDGDAGDDGAEGAARAPAARTRAARAPARWPARLSRAFQTRARGPPRPTRSTRSARSAVEQPLGRHGDRSRARRVCDAAATTPTCFAPCLVAARSHRRRGARRPVSRRPPPRGARLASGARRDVQHWRTPGVSPSGRRLDAQVARPGPTRRVLHRGEPVEHGPGIGGKRAHAAFDRDRGRWRTPRR